MIEIFRYNVGTSYISEDCQECICTLGGTPFCQPRKCDSCQKPGMRPVINELCNCVCKPCPTATRHCPTSDICIDENLWCNGIQDCPDDEKDCYNVTSTPSTVEYTSRIPILCQDPVCPPGYRINFKLAMKSRYKKSHGKAGVKSLSRHSWKIKELR